MSLRNTPASFGLISRLLHWGMALGILGMLPFGLFIARMEVTAESFPYFGWHKSAGLALLTIAALRILWHRASRPPKPLHRGIPVWQQRLARWVHGAFYVLLIALPLSGWVASSATGLPIRPLGLFTLPAIVAPSEALAAALFRLHGALALVLVLLVALHVAGALKRHIADGDRSLMRMLRGR